MIKTHLDRIAALWRYRGFVASMVWREFRGDYLGSLLGSIWSILNPLALIVIYTVIFSKIMNARLVGVDDTMGYGLFICSGLLAWGFFTDLLGRFPKIFVAHATLIKKVNFPRTTLPVILFLSCSINFLIIFAIFLLFLAVTGRFPGWAVLGFVPLLLIPQTFVLGAGIFLGIVNVFFRDVGHLLTIVLQFWFWFTPIIYPLTILPERVRDIIIYNPMTNFVISYQNIILKNQWPQWQTFAPHLIGALVTFWAGFYLFHKLSGEMVDEL